MYGDSTPETGEPFVISAISGLISVSGMQLNIILPCFFFWWLVYMQLSTLATSYDDQPSHDQLFLSLPFRQSFEKFLDLFSTGVTAVGVLVAARC